MSKHEGIIVATDETDHMAFLCPKCQTGMVVNKIYTASPTLKPNPESVTHIYLLCLDCGHNHWRKFDWSGRTATICKHRTDTHAKAAALLDRMAEAMALLERAEGFIAGFEDDENQEGIAELLSDIRAAKRGQK